MLHHVKSQLGGDYQLLIKVFNLLTKRKLMETVAACNLNLQIKASELQFSALEQKRTAEQI